MRKYIAKRVLLMIPTLFGVSVVIFIVMRVIPGDVVSIMYGDPISGQRRVDDNVRERAMKSLGLDKPYIYQYGKWIKDVATGNLGRRFLRQDPVSQILIRRGPVSAGIAIGGITLAFMIGVPLGVLSAVKPNSPLDLFARLFSILWLAMPAFWLGVLVTLWLINLWGYHAPIIPKHPWDDPWHYIRMVAGPTIIIGLGGSAGIARMTRSSVFEVLREDYVRTARAKGLRGSFVLMRHALPNALLPVITITGISVAALIGGIAALELAFGVPGLGRSLIDAARDRDIATVQNLVVFAALSFVVVNLLIDLSYAWIDPRIRYD